MNRVQGPVGLFPLITLTLATLLAGCAGNPESGEERRWLAGDHHIHSRYSVGWQETDPPTPVIGGDAIYPIPTNAAMARQHGLDWMVATDHGGPGHSKISLAQAYPELQQSRTAVPEVIQFFGLELNTPGADHSSIIIPHTDHEAADLTQYEARFDSREPWPPDPARQDESLMLEALRFADSLPERPVVIAHHPSRSAPAEGEFGYTTPAALRNWNDTAPAVAVGMEGAPGHQAGTISDRQYARGGYGRGFPTLGGFDQMTARLGGFWDSMLGEGRRWWITANSDSHVHYTEGGIDFWPGEYSKTYVYARKNHADILDGLRNGRVFVTLGDLVSELTVSVSDGRAAAEIGGELMTRQGRQVTIRIRARDPAGTNAAGRSPAVARIDLIAGDVTGPVTDRHTHSHASTRVLQRFSASDWQRNGEYLEMAYSFTPDGPMYIRVRGTSTTELEPGVDGTDENPWDDLWFYANPVFIGMR